MTAVSPAPRSLPGALVDSARSAGFSRNALAWIIVTPYVVTFLFALALAVPATRQFTTGQLSENSPVELLTALFLAIGGVLALRLVGAARRGGAPGYVAAFFAVFGVALLLVAMEEIAWGQWLLGFDTPEGLEEINEQNEVTIHNLRGVHGKTEFLRLAYGIGGLVGVALSSRPAFRGMTPPTFLVGWYLLIIVLVVPDLVNDFADIGDRVAALFDYLSELNELLVATVSILFIVVCDRFWRGRTGGSVGR